MGSHLHKFLAANVLYFMMFILQIVFILSYIVKYLDYKTFVVADIPGIIEGASLGKGLGLQFLKHIERTKILAFIIDINNESIMGEYEMLCAELEKYNPSLLKKPKILFVTKCETKDFKQQKDLNIKNVNHLYISSIKKLRIDKAKKLMYDLLD